MKRVVIALCIFAMSLGIALAQNKKDKPKTGSLSVVVLSPYSHTQGVNFKPVVSLITVKGDTLKDNGQQMFKNIPVGMTKIWVDAEGFLPVVDSTYINIGQNPDKFINVNDRVVDLQMITVEGQAPALVFRNDTLRFTPDGMNFADDDAARDVLSRMPGVEISEGAIKIGGQQIMKTYVDGRTSLFGDNVMTALDHIKASDVAHIYAYDEDERPEEKNENKRGKKQRVINIETKSKMLNSYDGVVFAGAGPTLGKTIGNNDLRYNGGASFNFFSDKWLLKVNALQNNQNSNSTNPSRFLSTSAPSSTYSENSVLSAMLERKWQGKVKGKDTKLSGEYSFNRTAPESMDYSETTYMASKSFTERQYTSQNLATSQDNQHKGNLVFSKKTEKYGDVNFDYSITATNRHAFTKAEDVDITDGVRVDELLTKRSRIESREHKANLRYIGDIGSKWSYILKSNFSNSNQDLENDRFTKVGNTITDLFIPEANRGGRLETDIEITYDSATYITDENGKRKLKHENDISFYYNFISDNRHLSRVAEDLSTGMIDEVNTYSFRNQLYEQKYGVDMNFANSGRKWTTNVKLGLDKATLADDRRDKVATNYDKKFLMPDIQLGLRQGGMGGFSANYSFDGILPNAHQIRSIVDNTNPLYLSAGNPNLKHSTEHTLALSYIRWKGGIRGSRLFATLNASLIDKFIISKTDYFAQDTYLSDYNYTAQAGSQMSSFANAGVHRNLYTQVSWFQPLTKLKSNYTILVSDDLSHTPYYFNGMDAINKNSFVTSIQIGTDAIKNAHFGLNYDFDYTDSRYEVSSNRNKIINNSVWLQGSINKILKRGFLKLSYRYSQEHYITRHTKDNEQKFNIYAGVNLNHGIELSVTAYDLLNKDSGRDWTVTDNYSRLKYRDNFGRYVSFNLKWNLSKVKSNRNVNGGINRTNINGVTVVTYSGDD